MLNFPVDNVVYIAFIASLCVGMAISLFFIGYIWQRRHIRGALPLLGILVAIVFWSLGYIIEYTHNALDIKLFSWNISYLGIVTLPVMLLLFAARYTRQDAWIKPSTIAALLVIPLITIVLQWTKGSHDLMYYNIHLIIDGPFLLAEKEHGAWFWVQAFYSYMVLVTSLAILSSRLFRAPRLLIDQVIYLIIATVVPVIANVIYIFNLAPIAHADWTPSAFAVTGVCLTLLITRHHFMDILPVARESAIELMQEGFLVIDSEQRMVDFNRAMQDILGLTRQQMLGSPLPDQIVKQLSRYHNPDEPDQYMTDIALDVAQKLHYYSVTVSPLKTGRRRVNGHMLVFHDFTERKLMEDAVKNIAYYDHLTGLPNRVLFNDRAAVAIEEAGRYQRKLAVMVMDIDKFKDINDNYGHDAGDRALQELAARLSEAVRKIDTVCRLGGDEFVILLPEISAEQSAEYVAQRISDSLMRPFTCDETECYITISIGIAIYPDDAADLKTLIKYGDMAMYHVKHTGRNGFARYRPGMGTSGQTAQESD